MTARTAALFTWALWGLAVIFFFAVIGYIHFKWLDFWWDNPTPKKTKQTVEMYYKALREDLPPAERKWFDQQAAAANLFWISSQNKYVQPNPTGIRT